MYGGAHRFELRAANGDGSGTLVRLSLPLQSENRATREAR
jgi:hypothetical protein